MNAINFDTYFSRHFPLSSIGKEGQLKLKYRSVLIAGVGGLGTVAAELLCSLGVGNIVLVDYDVIEESNLPRQKLFFPEDIGKAKVEVAEDRLAQKYPLVKITSHAAKIDGLSAPELIKGVDLVIDALDLFSTRKSLFRACYNAKIPVIFAGAIADSANLMTFDHLSDNPCYNCVLGNIDDDEGQSCAIRGVNPIILHIVVGFQISEALKILLDKTPLLNQTMKIIELNSLEIYDVKFNRLETCSVCNPIDSTPGKPGDIKKGNHEIEGFGSVNITSLCARNTWIIDPSWEIEWDFLSVVDLIKKSQDLYQITVTGDKYITIFVENSHISLLNTGVTTIKKSDSLETAIRLYTELMNYIKINTTTKL